MAQAITVELGASGFERGAAVRAIVDAGLEAHLRAAAAGPFGHRSWSLALLEALVEAGDLGLAAAEALRGAIVEELAAAGAGGSFAVPALGPEHRQLVSTFALVVLADALERGAAPICAPPAVAGRLELDGLAELLRADEGAEALLRRVLRLARAYAEREAGRVGEAAAAAGPVVAFFALLRAAAVELARAAAMRPLVAALARRQVTVAGVGYRGLERAAAAGPAGAGEGLLPVTVDDIVGNAEYLQAGLRLARDVAGCDLATRRNPKRFNPVLFGLGPPGSGKTVTAHAIGAYFLDYCRRRGVPARFRVVRRTDWASSYQNASASNLVRLFREEVAAADGVCGLYWPDIDTAFASRDSVELRQEEKQNLGAVFGIFDGTLLPRDGTWFLVCDANTLHMDEATISRVAQSPHRVEGPRAAADYARLMRGVLLRDLARFLPADDAAWERLGDLARELGLSGRHVESVCGEVRAHVQDFDYPDEYFAPGADRAAIVAGLGRPADEARIAEVLRRFAAFRRDADAAAERARFEDEVARLVRHLNAGRAAADQLAGGEPGPEPERP